MLAPPLLYSSIRMENWARKALPGTGTLPNVHAFSGKVQELETTVAQQAKAIEVLMFQLKEQAAQIQKVSAKIEMNNSSPHLALK